MCLIFDILFINIWSFSWDQEKYNERLAHHKFDIQFKFYDFLIENFPIENQLFWLDLDNISFKKNS